MGKGRLNLLSVGTIYRHAKLIAYLAERPRSLKDILFHVQTIMETKGFYAGYSGRTFLRDRDAFLLLYGIEVVTLGCNIHAKYTIHEDDLKLIPDSPTTFWKMIS